MATTDALTSMLSVNVDNELTGSAVDIAGLSISFAQPKGLQLGGNKVNGMAVTARLAEQVAAEEGECDTRSSNDLIDAHADEGDWSESVTECDLGVHHSPPHVLF